MMDDIHIIIENSPPRSGKDTVADMAMTDFADGAIDFCTNLSTQSFKEGLIEIALVISGVLQEEWDARYVSFKDKPWDKLGGLSQREYLIKISEEWVKPVHGKAHFGKLVSLSTRLSYERIKASYATPQKQLVLIPDGGFPEEIQPLFDEFGEDNVHILQWGRAGCSFENDSRNYIDAYPKNTRWIGYNNGTVEEFYQKFMREVYTLLESKGW